MCFEGYHYSDYAENAEMRDLERAQRTAHMQEIAQEEAQEGLVAEAPIMEAEVVLTCEQRLAIFAASVTEVQNELLTLVHSRHAFGRLDCINEGSLMTEGAAPVLAGDVRRWLSKLRMALLAVQAGQAGQAEAYSKSPITTTEA